MTDPPKLTIRVDTNGSDELVRHLRRVIRNREPSVQQALGRKRSRVVDRVVWTGTGIALGFGLALIAIGIYIRDLWIS